MAALARVTAPTVLPLTLDEVKANLRVTSSDQDDRITSLISAVTDFIDGEWGFLGRALVTQTWRLTLDGFPNGGQIRIPLPPLQSVTTVEYDDTAGNVQTVSSADYFVDTDSEPGWVIPVGGVASSWPSTLDGVNTVRVTFVAGYLPDASSPPDLAANVPNNIKQAMHLIIAGWMENREGIADAGRVINTLPFGADVLLRRHKIDRSLA